jgi:crotonobetainyl-CoA:carnitine CoA-transferase CaiB-like acyl-CoA transferase
MPDREMLCGTLLGPRQQSSPDIGRSSSGADRRFASNSRRTSARQELHDHRQAFSRLDSEQVIKRLDVAQIAKARE